MNEEQARKVTEAIENHIKELIIERMADSDDSYAGFGSYHTQELLIKVLQQVFPS